MTTNAFELTTNKRIESLNIDYQEYQHAKTNAKHIHLAAENNENVFMVALRTVPQDSTGVAHILEHTSLCGSQRYPVRDPFFMMTRRSLNTFMNAFTSSDWTAYPFASQNKKDFDNLLSVYLDAVFFARLDELDFAQEGHRLEFEEPANPSSQLLYKGVVFNEMKGAMSSISSQLWQELGSSLFPETTYGFNSGGDPKAIPNLSYTQLKAFYQTHYHPDNAVFLTYGDISPQDHQEKFESLVLNHFEPLNQTISVPLQPQFSQPTRSVAQYPLADSDQPEKSTHQVMAWILGDIRDPLELMSAHLLSSILLEDSASPLQHALETTDLGSSPSPLCGMDDSGLQMIFACGLQGCSVDSTDEFEAFIIDTLEKLAVDGLPLERLTALLDQLELQQREISGDSYPYGLQIMLSCLATAMHRGDCEAALNIDPIIAQLRDNIAQPDFVQTLIRRLLLDNPHRVTLTMHPDAELNQRNIDEELAKLSAIRQQLNDADIETIVQTAAALQQRQAQQDDPELLPKVTLDDVKPDIDVPHCENRGSAQQPLTFYPQGTNGLIYRQLITPLPALDEDQISLLSLHNRILTEVGIGNKDYLQTQHWQTNVCGGINAFSSIRPARDNEQEVSGYLTVSAKGLSSKAEQIEQLLKETYLSPRFTEQQRIADLIAQSAARAEQSVTGSGHSLAMAIACQHMSPAAKLSHASSGILGIKHLKSLDESLNKNSSNTQAREQLSARLSTLHQWLTGGSLQHLAVTEAQRAEAITALVDAAWNNYAATTQTDFSLPAMRQTAREIWVCNSQVNFCAKAYATVPSSHSDAAALTVLAGVLRNGFLHTAIREQGGAYGGGASHDSSNGAFRFYSYRDPRMSETLDDFDRSIEWLLTTKHPWRVIEEAILGVVSSLDKPSSPAGTAKQHFYNCLFGRTPEHQQTFRNAVLDVTETDLKRVAEQYLAPDKASIGIITHAGEKEQYQQLEGELGLTVCSL